MTRTVRLSLALLACASAGCAAEAQGPAQGPVVASAPHRVVWQQFCEQAWNISHANAIVAARGADGWELVAMYNGVLCYKRPVPDPREPPRTPAYLAPGYGAPASTPAPSSNVPIMRDPGF